VAGRSAHAVEMGTVLSSACTPVLPVLAGGCQLSGEQADPSPAGVWEADWLTSSEPLFVRGSDTLECAGHMVRKVPKASKARRVGVECRTCLPPVVDALAT
jgi:hypothetical protein